MTAQFVDVPMFDTGSAFSGEIHPAAALFPMIPDAALDQLAGDIRARGLIHPLVTTPDGQLLDGRNRLEACRRAGVDPRWTVYAGGDPVRFVMSLNLERRHLSEDERGFLGVELLPIIESEQRIGRPPKEPTEWEKSPLESEDISRIDRESTAKAAQAVKVTRDRIIKAKRVIEHAPDLVEQVKSGAISMSKAEAVAKDREAGLTEADADAWFTPPWIFDQIGLRFDLDVCAPHNAAARTCPADRYYTEADDGLTAPWHGLVWCNPPYSDPTPWAERMIAHGNGIMLAPFSNKARWTLKTLWAASSLRWVGWARFLRPNGAIQSPNFSLMLATFGDHLADALTDVDDEMVGPLWRADR